MRFTFWVRSALTVCLALLLGLVSGRTQNPSAPAPGPQREVRTQPLVGQPSTNQPLGATRPPFQLPISGIPIVPNSPTDWIEERFRRQDRDTDGLLSFEEMTESLKSEKEKWDANKDGQIDLDEWRKYVTAALTRQQPIIVPDNRPRDPEHAPLVQNPGQEPRRPTAVRPPFDESRSPKSLAQRNGKGAATGLGKLPSNVPAWFKEYDIDGDGQIALHEWKNRKDGIQEFRKYDLNEDGVITLGELIRSGQFTAGMNRTVPPSVSALRAEVGEFFYFEVTGSNLGNNVWGTDIYTTDSSLRTAAVHAGVLQVGQTRLVKVTILAGEESYQGSARNDVMSHDFGPFPRSYRVEPAP